MARNINQIFADNPITDVQASDVFYVGRGGVDAAIQGTNLFNASGSNATLNKGTFVATTNQLVLGITKTTTISATAPASSSIYTIPDVGTSANFIFSAGTQTIGGSKTFSSSVVINPATNQLVFGTTNTTTINSTAPSASRVYTIPDAGADANFVMSEGIATINGAKTFSANTSVKRSDAGNSIIFLLQNDSTTTGSNAVSRVFINNSGSGDSYWQCGHAAAQQYSFGFDNDDSDAFVFSVGSALGTANAARISTSGSWNFPNIALSQSFSSSGAAVAFTVENTSNTASSDALIKVACGGTSGGDAYHLFSIPSGTSYSMGADNSDGDAFVLSVGTALGTANALRCDSSGRFNYPTQPRFLAANSATDTNSTGDGTNFTVICDSVSFDIGSNYNSGTGTFTAPITGIYRLDTSITASSIGAGHVSASQDFFINGSTTIATESGMSPATCRDTASNNFCNPQASRLVSLTAGDTVVVRYTVSGSTKTVGILGNAFFSTFFSGMLVA